MRNVLHSVIVFFSFVSLSLFSQTKKSDTVFCDCNKARAIKISGSQKIGVTIAPTGFGEKQEISELKLKTKFAFEKEHHTAWYKLLINTNGYLSFDIIPEKPDDDYDFMLFKAGKNNFCDSLDKYKLKSVRANISRDKTELSGKTGLSSKAKKELVQEGVNDAYSTPIKVNKGEIYYLVLDNVYEKGGGHTIEFYFEQKVSIKGIVKNDADRPLKATVSITNIKGKIIAETTSDSKTGVFEINTAIRKNVNYSINYFNDSSFIYSKTISLKDSIELKDIRVVLPKLKEGETYSIWDINFVANSSEYLPSAIPSIENLCNLMLKNKTLSILIEGHVNCASHGLQFFSIDIDEMKLSEDRAKKIRDYLIRRKISLSRIKTEGKGCNGMLFPFAMTPEEQEANRRVEIKVLEY